MISPRFKQLAARLAQYADSSDAPAPVAWVHELARLTACKLQWSAGGYLNRLAFERWPGGASKSDAYVKMFADGEPRFHIIVVPNVLHFLVPSVRLVPGFCAKGFVLNLYFAKNADSWLVNAKRQQNGGVVHLVSVADQMLARLGNRLSELD